MRTKALVMAAVLAASMGAAWAQNVYSVNVVGYINLELTNGWNLVANQLDKDGYGTNNTLATVFGDNLPAGSQVVKFVGGGWNVSASYVEIVPGTKMWLPDGNLSANPGEGLMIGCPNPGKTTVTVVGNVLEGAQSNPYNAGWSVRSSKVPQQGLVATDLGFPAAAGDQLVFWDGVSQSYATSAAYIGVWLPSEPTIAVGQSFFISSTAGGSWNRTFNVPRP